MKYIERGKVDMEMQIVVLILILFIYGCIYSLKLKEMENLEEKYIKLENKYNNLFEIVDLKDIKIKKDFKKHKPNKNKLIEKERYFLENNDFESAIILNKQNELEDGYTSYLIAKKHDINKLRAIKF